MKRQMFIFSIISVLLAAGIAIAQTPVSQGQSTNPADTRTDQAATGDPKGGRGVHRASQTAWSDPEGRVLVPARRRQDVTRRALHMVYGRGETGKFDKLVVSFHCIPVEREQPAEQFKADHLGNGLAIHFARSD